jgi:hypothetical protein
MTNPATNDGMMEMNLDLTHGQTGSKKIPASESDQPIKRGG